MYIENDNNEKKINDEVDKLLKNLSHLDQPETEDTIKKFLSDHVQLKQLIDSMQVIVFL